MAKKSCSRCGTKTSKQSTPQKLARTTRTKSSSDDNAVYIGNIKITLNA